ncbi:hypothetical protein [Dietzia maris]|uniref:hypothetical protein n=1 Tax=Dietzia maris TaxID=37915 RepID=UPI0037CB9DEE
MNQPDVTHVVERALAYTIVDDPQSLGAVTLGVEFSSDSGQWPQPLDEVPADERAMWMSVADELTHPLPRTHLRDLAMLTGAKMDRPAISDLADSYLALGEDQTIDPLHRVNYVRRSMSIARKYGLQIEAATRSLLYRLAKDACESEFTLPSLIIGALDSLASKPRSGVFEKPSRDEVKKLIRALVNADVDMATVEHAVQLLERIAETTEEQELARRDLVEKFIATAGQSTGIAATYWLNEAAMRAEKFSLLDLRNKAISAMQNQTASDLDLHTLSSNLVMPRYIHDARMDRYRYARNSFVALDIWLTSPSPTGRHEENLLKAKESAGDGILTLAIRTILSPEGLPIRTTSGLEESEREWLERLESLNFAVHSAILGGELNAIRVEYGPQNPTELASHLAATYQCDAELAMHFAQSLNSFWEERYADSARAAFPIVEAAIRGLLLKLDEPLYRVESATSAGRFPALETYITRLEKKDLDPDWVRCLRNPISRLRNSIAHGHKFDITDYEAAGLLRAAGLFTVLTPTNSRDADRAEVALRLRDPVGWTGSQAPLVKRWRRDWVAANGTKSALIHGFASIFRLRS